MSVIAGLPLAFFHPSYWGTPMASTMTINQARAEKIEAEEQILKIINGFLERTGASLRGFEMRHPEPTDPLEYRLYGETVPGKLVAIELKIEL